MVQIEIVIQGDLSKILDEPIERFKKKVIDALAEAAIEAYVTAKQVVPIRTGLLYRSIKLEKKSPFEHVVSAGWPTKEKGKPYYAPFVEFGTRKMAPRPYMKPAAEKAIMILKEKL
jgi:HK97 gp10 family phage protein